MKIPTASTFSNATVVSGPGDYFVSAIDGAQFFLMAGPFGSHEQAAESVDRVRALCNQHDQSGKAAFMGYGTCRLEPGSGRIGTLNRLKLI